MKKLFLTILILTSSVMAQEIEVIVPVPVGNILDLKCRNIMESYDTLYGTKSVIFNVPGAEQLIAHKKFISSKSKLLCAGSAPVLNEKLFPNSPPANTIRPIIGITSYSQFMFSPIGNPSTIEGLIKRSKETGKSILVGGFSQNSVRLTAIYLEKHNVKYELVIYKNPTESLISLREGNLDVYVDSGTIKQLLDQYSYVREIAHISSVSKISSSKNLYDSLQPHSAGLLTTTFFYSKSDMPDEEVQLFNKRLMAAIESPNSQVFFKTRIPSQILINSTTIDAERRLTNLREYQDKYYVHN